MKIYEPYTEQYIEVSVTQFWTTMTHANKRFLSDGECDLNFIISSLGGVPDTSEKILGWSLWNDIQDFNWSFYGGPWIEPILFEMEDERDAYYLDYQVGPEYMEQ